MLPFTEDCVAAEDPGASLVARWTDAQSDHMSRVTTFFAAAKLARARLGGGGGAAHKGRAQ